MSTYDDLEPVQVESGPIRGIIDSNPSDEGDPLFVRLPTYDEHLRFGPCKWQFVGAMAMPGAGDECLVLFDNLNMPWVVVYWPYGGDF